MSKVTIYHNPRCAKSRETLKLLQSKGVEPEVVEYLNDVPSQAKLKELIEYLGIKPNELLRKKEKDFDQFKGKSLTDAQTIKAMTQFPKLIERPIVVKGKKAVLGRPPENVLELI